MYSLTAYTVAAPTDIYSLSLHDALPIFGVEHAVDAVGGIGGQTVEQLAHARAHGRVLRVLEHDRRGAARHPRHGRPVRDGAAVDADESRLAEGREQVELRLDPREPVIGHDGDEGAARRQALGRLPQLRDDGVESLERGERLRAERRRLVLDVIEDQQGE